MSFRLFICFLAGILFMPSCNNKTKVQPFPPPHVPPQLSLLTSQISSVTYNSACSGVYIFSEGSSPVIEMGICWDTSPEPTIYKNKTSEGTGNGDLTYKMTDLKMNTTYYVKAYARDSSGVVYGDQRIFKTPTEWTKTTGGLDKGFNCMASFGLFLYAGTPEDGIFLSTDNGNTWQSSTPDYHKVTALVEKDDKLFAATLDGGIITADQTGWEQKNNGLPNLKTVTLVKYDDLYTLIDGKVYKTSDNGDNWRHVAISSSISVGGLWATYYGVLIYDTNTNAFYRLGRTGTITLMSESPVANPLILKSLGGSTFLGSANGAYFTYDGFDWRKVSDSHLNNRIVSDFSEHNRSVYAAVNNEVFLEIVDDNAVQKNWTRASTGLPANNSVVSHLFFHLGIGYASVKNGASSSTYKLE